MPRKGARKIVVSGTAFRWAVVSSSPPDLALVAELHESPASRAMLHVPYGIRITPKVAASIIKFALDSGWNPQMRGSDKSIRFTVDMIADPQSAVHQCPCCDYFSLPTRGEHEICPICFWEDSRQDLDRIDMHSGPNRMTLREARANFIAMGACDHHSIRDALSEEKRAAFRREQRNA
jgi:hypothetical protein